MQCRHNWADDIKYSGVRSEMLETIGTGGRAGGIHGNWRKLGLPSPVWIDRTWWWGGVPVDPIFDKWRFLALGGVSRQTTISALTFRPKVASRSGQGRPSKDKVRGERMNLGGRTSRGILPSFRVPNCNVQIKWWLLPIETVSKALPMFYKRAAPQEVAFRTPDLGLRENNREWGAFPGTISACHKKLKHREFCQTYLIDIRRKILNVKEFRHVYMVQL